MDIHLPELCQELKEYIRKYNHQSFITHWCYIANAHWRMQTDKLKLLSPIRQLMYLMSLYHSTDFSGNERFEPIGGQYENIVRLLNEIEQCYILKPSQYSTSEYDYDYYEKLFISNTTFLNYYLNAPLSYCEQDIEKIRETFKFFENHIKENTGLIVEDFINFFLMVSDLEVEKYNDYFLRKYTKEEENLIQKMQNDPSSITFEDFQPVTELVENSIFGLGIPICRLKEQMPDEKIETLLILFTMTKKENENYLYYSDICPYLLKPILMSSPSHISFVYSKQLISAIYEYLFDLCIQADQNGRKILMRRENYLEYKTQEVLKDFFENDAKIISNYQVNGNEKDLIVLKGKYAYIIECKANKYRIPFRDPIRAYDRINDDFKKSIGKGYQQAYEIEKLFEGTKPFDIKNDRGKVIEKINPSKFHEVFTIIVTQERFGQIQCDLKYLLPIEETDNVPWSVCIDDLETFLITLKRKRNSQMEFPVFLLKREKFYGRVFCSDELELCAYFLFDRDLFFKYANSDQLFLSSPDVHKFFDELYHVGFGFKNEVNILDKAVRFSAVANAIIKKNQLKRPQRLE